MINDLYTIAKIAAIATGAIWTWLVFTQRRQNQPRGKISHSVKWLRIDEVSQLLRVSIMVENPGQILFVPKSWIVTIRNVDCKSAELKACAEWSHPEENLEGLTTGNTVEWPLLKRIVTDCALGEVEIEPQESDEWHYDIIVPNSVAIVQIYSDFEPSSDSLISKMMEVDRKPLFLRLTTVHSRVEDATK